MNICLNCGDKTSNPKFCSLSCSAKYQYKDAEHNHIFKKCETCGKEFNAEYNKKRKFCSVSCSVSASNSITKVVPRSVCKNCGEQVGYVKGKFCSNECFQSFRSRKRIAEWLETGILLATPAYGTPIRDFIYEQQNHLCAICSRTNLWEGKELRFVLDHIDGNSDNNFRSNLRLICPNCDSQLETFKSKNKNSGRAYRRERYAAGKSF